MRRYQQQYERLARPRNRPSRRENEIQRQAGRQHPRNSAVERVEANKNSGRIRRRDSNLGECLMTCSVCGAEPCINRSFCRVCRNADRRRTRSKHNDGRLSDARPTPQATIEAVMHAVRERGLAALKEPIIAARIERCDPAAKAEIEQRITNLRKDQSHA